VFVTLSLLTLEPVAAQSNSASGADEGEPVTGTPVLLTPRGTSARIGSGVTPDGREVAIVWLDSRSAFVPLDGGEIPEELCVAETCVPAIDHETCAEGECPFAGHRITAAQAIARVAPWTRQNHRTELARLMGDPEAEHITRGQGAHREEMPDSLDVPDPGLDVELPEWSFSNLGGTLGVEIGLGAIGGSFTRSGGSWWGGVFDLVAQYEMPAGDPPWLGALLANGIGLGFRAQLLRRTDGENAGSHAVMLAGVLSLTNRIRGTPVRTPSLLGVLLPEVGAVLYSESRPARGYFDWSVPVTITVATHLAVDVRPRVQLLLPTEETRAELFLGASISFSLVQLGIELPPMGGGSWFGTV